jgi:peptidoglycan/LPS O-acetylase OafA/YrhL
VIDRPIDQLANVGGAIQQAVVAVAVQMGEWTRVFGRFRHHRGSFHGVFSVAKRTNGFRQSAYRAESHRSAGLIALVITKNAYSRRIGFWYAAIMNIVPLHTSKSPLTAKFAGLDAVRGFAALGVVLFHACIPYLKHPMPGLTWAVRDDANGVTDFFYWWMELFIMPLFLVMAGFLAWKTFQKRGRSELIMSRARRLLKPLLFGIVVVLPLDLYCWVLGWVADGIVPAVKLRSLKFDPHLDRNLWGLSHLWFLQYLFLYVVVFAVASSLGSRFSILRRIRLGPKAIVGMIVFLGSTTLYFHPEVVWGFQHDFLPVASKWIYSGLSFALGAALANFDGELDWLKASANRIVPAAAVCSVAAVLLGQWHLSGGQSQQAQVALAGLTCVSSVLISLSIIGVAVARVGRVSNVVGYLSAASFWVYIVHHPILGLVHTDLKFLMPGMSPVLKTIIAFAVTSGFCLATYETFVRKTRLGIWLGFSWTIPAPTDSASESSIPFPSRRSGVATAGRRAA